MKLWRADAKAATTSNADIFPAITNDKGSRKSGPGDGRHPGDMLVANVLGRTAVSSLKGASLL